MKYDLDGSTIQLKAHDVISLANPKGSTIAVLWGSVWLTQDSDLRDHELGAGESYTIPSDSKVVLSAFDDSAISVLQPCESARKNLRYLTSEELRQFERDAHELRAVYVASITAKLVEAIRRGFSKLYDFAMTLRLKHARWQWSEPRHRVYW